VGGGLDREGGGPCGSGGCCGEKRTQIRQAAAAGRGAAVRGGRGRGQRQLVVGTDMYVVGIDWEERQRQQQRKAEEEAHRSAGGGTGGSNSSSNSNSVRTSSAKGLSPGIPPGALRLRT